MKFSTLIFLTLVNSIAQAAEPKVPVLDVVTNKIDVLKLADEGGSAGSSHEIKFAQMSRFVCWVVKNKRKFILNQVSDMDKVEESCNSTPVHFVNAILLDKSNGVLTAQTYEDETSMTGYRTFISLSEWKRFFQTKENEGDIIPAHSRDLFELIWHERLLGAGEKDQDKHLSKDLDLTHYDWQFWLEKSWDKIVAINDHPNVEYERVHYTFQEPEISKHYDMHILRDFELNHPQGYLKDQMEEYKLILQNTRSDFSEQCMIRFPKIKRDIESRILTNILTFDPNLKGVKVEAEVKMKSKYGEPKIYLATKGMKHKLIYNGLSNDPKVKIYSSNYNSENTHKFISLGYLGCGNLDVSIQLTAPSMRIIELPTQSVSGEPVVYFDNEHDQLNYVLMVQENDKALENYKKACVEYKQRTYQKFTDGGHKVLYVSCGTDLTRVDKQITPLSFVTEKRNGLFLKDTTVTYFRDTEVNTSLEDLY